MTIETAIALFTALGVAGVFGAYFQAGFERLNQVRKIEHEQKHIRYKALAILLLVKLNPDEIKKIHNNRPDLRTIEDIDAEIRLEFFNSFLFASDDVIKAFSKFIVEANYHNYANTILAMRQDLWDKKTSLKPDIIDVAIKDDLLLEVDI